LPKAIELAARIASRGPLAVAEAKRAIEAGADVGLPAAIELESQAFGRCFATADQKEGMAAFLAKRPAQFSGK
ncbi:MAG: enoyl-CoA hydratase/isomerase family protein, partial [Deltaproteobacteria bacterium]|nr:enoyl-CoA hydratase/isomerase family protein [Deltaproteobacteria bacterium]